jgi:hypothetical protein
MHKNKEASVSVDFKVNLDLKRDIKVNSIFEPNSKKSSPKILEGPDSRETVEDKWKNPMQKTKTLRPNALTKQFTSEPRLSLQYNNTSPARQ